jgi:hypothetical protein
MQTNFALFKGKKQNIYIQVDKFKETFWINQSQIQEIFGIDQSVISRHINKIFKDKEIDQKSNMQK